jgi:malate synthase
VGIFNLMEDAATAEISRGELWQWVSRGAKLDDGRPLTAALYKDLRADELAKLGGLDKGRMRETVEIFDGLVLNEKFDSFLTLPAYRYLKNV